MDGVKILYQWSEALHTSGLFIIVGFFGAIIILTSIFYIITLLPGIKLNDVVIPLIALLGGILLIYASAHMCDSTRYFEERYKVEVSDKVLFNDFQKRYKIIKQEGQIYTVVERGIEDE